MDVILAVAEDLVVDVVWSDELLDDPVSYRHLVDETPGSDPDDRVHTAAAIAGGASVLVTRKRCDFPIQHLSQHGVAVMSADELLSRLLRHRPTAVVETIRRVAAEKRCPSLTPCDLAGRLARVGTPTFAGGLARRLGCDDIS